MAASSSSYRVRSSGDPKTDKWRLFYSDASGKPISPFHDIPLSAGDGLFHMVVEIPRGLNAKLEINKSEPLNPIKQDIKRGALRFVHDVHPYQGYIWNYGAFPQTWEDPTHKDEGTGAYGDNDPLDVCEIGSKTATIGEVKVVKVLGVIALIDEGETDWKVLTIDVTDPLASQLNDIDDVNRLLPGLTMATYEWFRTYKMPTGAPPNEFAFNGAAKDKAFALQVIQQNHQFWQRLHSGETPASGKKSGNGEAYEVNLLNTTLGAHTFAGELPDLGDQGLPVSNSAQQDDPEVLSIKYTVESSQRAKPHGTATLSAALHDIGAAIATSERNNAAISAKLATSANLKNITTVNAEGNRVTTPAAGGYYSVAFHCGHHNTVVFGLYQDQTAHTLPHAGEFAAQVASEGFGEIVAAGVVSGDHLALNSGAGRLSFTLKEGSFVASSVEVGSVEGDSSCVVSYRAPLALFAAL